MDRVSPPAGENRTGRSYECSVPRGITGRAASLRRRLPGGDALEAGPEPAPFPLMRRPGRTEPGAQVGHENASRTSRWPRRRWAGVRCWRPAVGEVRARTMTFGQVRSGPVAPVGAYVGAHDVRQKPGIVRVGLLAADAVAVAVAGGGEAHGRGRGRRLADVCRYPWTLASAWACKHDPTRGRSNGSSCTSCAGRTGSLQGPETEPLPMIGLAQLYRRARRVGGVGRQRPASSVPQVRRSSRKVDR